MKTYFNTACLKWFFGIKFTYIHTKMIKTYSFEVVKFVRQVLHSGLHWHHDVTVAIKVILSMRSSVLLLLKMTLEFLKHSLSTNKTKQAHAVMHKYMYCKSTCSIDNFQGTIRTLWKSNVWPWEFGMTCVLTLRVWHDLCTDLESLASPVYFISSNSIWSFSLSSFSRVICFSLSFCSASRCLVVSSCPSNRRTTSCYADNTILKIWSTLQQILV